MVISGGQGARGTAGEPSGWANSVAGYGAIKTAATNASARLSLAFSRPLQPTRSRGSQAVLQVSEELQAAWHWSGCRREHDHERVRSELLAMPGDGLEVLLRGRIRGRQEAARWRPGEPRGCSRHWPGPPGGINGERGVLRASRFITLCYPLVTLER